MYSSIRQYRYFISFVLHFIGIEIKPHAAICSNKYNINRIVLIITIMTLIMTIMTLITKS